MIDDTITPVRWRLNTPYPAPAPANGSTATEAPAFRGYDPAANDRLAASFELMQALLNGADLTTALNLMIDRAGPMAGARLAFIALPDEPPSTLTVVLATGTDADRVRGLNVRVGTSVIGRVYSTRRAVASRVASEPAAKGLPMGPMLLLPFDTGEYTRGVLGLSGGPGAMPFSANIKRQLLIFATTSAAMIEMAEERRAAGLR